MAVRDSLFSLEVIVDKLVLSSVTCRFPAIAFRLLDFPTLLVEHVEPELSDRIKKKISIEMQANLPRQLKELQDKNGAFLIKRGKSCLFKISSETLQIHLSNTPLYVLVIDQFPETPKLVASCLIPLNGCMEKIQNDIEKLGITVPHVHGEKGQYKLYNLMGIEVGHVDIACRLLSLGEGLMQHIPDHAIAKFGANVQTGILAKKDSPRKTKPGTQRKSEDGSPRKVDDSPRKAKSPRHVVIKTPPRHADDDDLIVEDLEAPEKAQPIIISSAKDAIDAAKKGRELESSGTQTERPRKSKHVQFPSSDLSDELDNVYLTNTYCPPPLFYNSTAEEKLPPSKLEIYEYHSRPANPLEVKDFDTESVRSDDALFDLIEQGLDQTLIKPPDTKFIHYQHSLLPPPPPKQPDLQQMLMSPNFQGGQFPFLRALTAELAFIQNTQAQVVCQSQRVGRAKGSPVKATEISQQQKHRSPQTPRDVQLYDAPPAEKENREHFLTRLAAPKRKLPEKQGAVPSNKGWLRKEPAFGQMKTKPKFSYGMTNTQRLRLAQVNPELLHSLELEQEEIKLRKQQEQFDNMSNIQKAMAKTFVLKPASRGKDDVSTVDSRTMVVQKPSNKKPVPMPRKVSIDDNAAIKEVSQTELMYEARLAQAQVPIDHPDSPTGKVMKLEDLQEADYNYEPSGSGSKESGGSSQKSIEVRIPAVSMNDSASYSTDGDSRPSSLASKDDDIPVKDKPVHTEDKPPKYGQARSSYPGFPTAFQPNDTQTTAKTESTLHYTADFEDSKQWMSTDEPELQALRFSGSDEGSESRTLTGEASDPTDDGVRTSTTIRIPIVNPKASLSSPKAAMKKSASFRAADSTARTLEGDSSSEKGSSSPTPKPRKSVTPPSDGSPQRLKLQRSVSFEFDEEKPAKERVPPPYPRTGARSADPVSSLEMSLEKPNPQRRSIVGRSPSAESVESPTRQRKGLTKPTLQSIHTESVSSYMPSDLDLNMTYDGSDGDYSDDFDNSEGAYQPVYKPASEATVAKGAGRLGYTWN